ATMPAKSSGSGVCCCMASLPNRRILLLVLRWPRKQLAGPAGEPIGDEAHPFAQGGIGSAQASAGETGKAKKIVTAAHPPIHRISLHGKSHLAKQTDRAWHMKRRGHQE